jgi:CRISPR-associated protein Cas1
MIKRTIFFSNPVRLSVRDKQLIISLKEDNQERTIPVEDIGYIVLDNNQISFTMNLLEEMNNNNVAVIFCNNKHLPNAMLLNLDGHHLQTELFRNQIEASGPIKKNLWKQTIEAKIRNQAALLKKLEKEYRDLKIYAGNVKSGDSDNKEGAASRLYWPRLLGNGFIRDRYGPPPNQVLNYGYTILRAAVARALCGSGLLPTLGIQHHNRYNAFCLADDIMEPYRPFVDEIVNELKDKCDEQIIVDKEIKAELLKIMTVDVKIGVNRRPLMIGITHTTASLARCFSGETRKIIYPELI